MSRPPEGTSADFTTRHKVSTSFLSGRAAAFITLGACLLVCGLFWESASSMVAVWYRSRTFAHGFLILPLSVYLVWPHRHKVASLVPTPNLWGLSLLTVIGFGWLLGNLADVLVVQQFALVAMLQGIIWTVLGTAVTRVLLFPLAFLFFAVPVGEDLIPYLQDFTAFFAVEALQLSGVPVFAEGRFIDIPSGRWEVAEACSGIRYLITSLVLGCLYAGVTYRSWTRRVGFILVSVIVPIVANGLRVYGILMLAYFSDGKFAKGVDHLIAGWIFLGIITCLLFSLGLLWQEPADHESTEASPRSLPSNVFMKKMSCASSTRAAMFAAASGVAILALAPLSAQTLSNRALTPVVSQIMAPSVTVPWKMLAEYSGNWTPQFIGADAEVRQSYTVGDQQVHLYIAYYASEHQGAELINSENVLFDNVRWKRVTERHSPATVDDQSFSVHETVIQSAFGSRLVWSWYWVNGEFTPSPYYAKLLQVKTKLFGGSQGAAVMAVSADFDGRQADAAHVLQEFLHHASLQTTLLKTH